VVVGLHSGGHARPWKGVLGTNLAHIVLSPETRRGARRRLLGKTHRPAGAISKTRLSSAAPWAPFASGRPIEAFGPADFLRCRSMIRSPPLRLLIGASLEAFRGTIFPIGSPGIEKFLAIGVPDGELIFPPPHLWPIGRWAKAQQVAGDKRP